MENKDGEIKQTVDKTDLAQVMTAGKSEVRRIQELLKQLPNNGVRKAFQDGMKAAISSNWNNPIYSTHEERMFFRSGWMYQMKKSFSK